MNMVLSVRTVWGAALLLGLVGFVAARYRRWLVLPALTVIGVLAYWQLSELADAAVRPGIIQEAGGGYLIQSCAAVAVGGLLSGLGVGPKRGAGLHALVDVGGGSLLGERRGVCWGGLN